MKTIGDLYSSYIWENSENNSLNYFYNYIPRTHLASILKSKSLVNPSYNPDSLVKLKDILFSYHKNLGLLTPKVEKNIENLDKGVVLAGQQATIFGGAGLIANKIAATINLSEISVQKGHTLVPVFLVNTHDVIQPEITTIHFPNVQSASSKAISLSNGVEGVSSHFILLDDYNWLDDNLAKIENIFNEFRSTLPREKQPLYLERVDHILTFLRETYRSSSSFGEWISLIYGIQANIINDWGLVLFPTSHPEIRRLLVQGYYPILQNRDEYIHEFNRATDKIVDLGLNPTTRKKKPDYSPFFYECSNGHRISLHCKREGDTLTFYNICPVDDEEIFFSTSISDMDLSSVATRLSARLDTNQATFQSIMPVYLRVSGPGEINYNGQVIPAIRKIGLQFPILVKYTRMLYNANWIEDLSKKLEIKEYSLFTKDFFRLLGSVAKARKKNEPELLFEASSQLRAYILAKLELMQSVSAEPTALISIYKAWQWGIYEKNKKWQEVSYPWFFMASITGLRDYLASYRRQYSLNSPVGGIGFINSII
ncbi:MAG: bacillithiol biosynthesis protein BshC [Candidatus Heimdallarchaeaceae archaeon]